MELLTPAGLAALSLLVPLVAMYFYRRQRVRREVPSLQLWRAVQRELSQRAGLRRLRSTASLWLHVVALALAALALATPLRRARVSPAGRLVVVVDTTASMSALTPSGRTRMDDARALALAALGELSRGGEASLVEAGCVPRVVVPATREVSSVARGIASLAPRDCGGDLSRALALAGDRLRGAGADRRVVVLTDGTTRADAVTVSLPGRVDVRLVGVSVENTGVVATELREDLSPRPGSGGRRFGLFVALHHAGAPRDVTLRAALLRGGETVPVAVRNLRVSQGRSSATLPLDLAEGETADLVEVSLQGRDSLATDDRAWASVPPPGRLPVRLVTSTGAGAPWVARALRADPQITLRELSRARYDAEASRAFQGLTVFQGSAPEGALEGEHLVLSPQGARAAGFSLGETLARPRWTDVSPLDPRVRFVGVADVHVPSARRVILDPRDVPLVTSTAGPLIVARDSARGSTTLVAFDPERTDWPLRPGFVLFFRDATEWARARRSSLGVEARRTGAPVSVPATGVDRVRITDPSGGVSVLPVRDGVASWVGGERSGVYVLDRGRGRERVGLALLDATESALVRAELPWRGTVVHAGTATAYESRELSPWLALGALALLSLEWWAFTGARLWPRRAASLELPTRRRA